MVTGGSNPPFINRKHLFRKFNLKYNVMTKLSYHASHEQFKPGKLLEWVVKAEQAGFQGAMSSDHFFPWNHEQGESGFAWSWLGAAMARTDFTFGVVNAPGQRYHPAIIAQASATLAEMFPERFWIAVGSGQNLNEHITGAHWPNKQERNARLKECADVIRALWNGEIVNHTGLVTVEEAKLYTRPEKPPMMVGAAITAKTAEWLGGWADALITVSHPVDKLKKVIEAFRRGGGEGKPVKVKMQLSVDSTEEKALEGAFKEWKTNIFQNNMLTELRIPQQFQEAAEYVEPEMLKDHVKISADPEKHIHWIHEYMELGVDEIILHNVNENQEHFIEVFGNKVLPKLLKR
jgi:coenzyme F420-dependent glucose-6-phosphate dehydrogenase